MRGASPGRVEIALLTLICAWCAGCGDGSDESDATLECDPFASHPLPIALGTLLGAGKDEQGTIYVADELEGLETRVFVSSGKQLIRQRVAGSGSEGSDFHVFTVNDHDPAFTLQIEGKYPKSARMGVFEGPLTDRKMFTIGEDGEELSIVAESSVRALSLRNLPGDIALEYADRLADGRLLVVTRPEDDWTDDNDIRVFLGPKSALAERRLIDFSRGNDTYVTFDVDGAEAEAFFPLSITEQGSVYGTPTLTIKGEPQDMVRLDDRPDDAHYTCFAH